MGAVQTFNQRVAIGITTGLFVLTTFVVYMRLYIRCILLKAGSAGWDDLTVFIAWVMALGASIATYFEVISGLGRHIQELSPKQVYDFGLSLFIVIEFYNVGLNTVKISFLAQYHRLFPDPLIRRICFYFGMFCFFWMFAQAVLYAFSCVPIAQLVPRMEVVCIPTLPTWTAISSINVLTDLLIFCIPLKPLWGMPLLKRQRYLLIGIFCVGFLVCIISIIRIPTLRRGAASHDPSWTNVTTALWSLAELDTAILCTSLPILRPLVARFVRGVAPADAPAGRLKGGPGRPGERDRDRDREQQQQPPPRRPNHKLPGESLLYDTGLSGSTLQSGGRSFLRSLLSSGNRDRDRDRDRDGGDDAADTELRGEQQQQQHLRRGAPTTTTTITTTTVEVDAPKGSFEGMPLDAPAGTFKKDLAAEKMVPRPPLTFYPRTFPLGTNNNNKPPPVPVIPPPPIKKDQDPPTGRPSPFPITNPASPPPPPPPPTSPPLNRTLYYHVPTSVGSASPRRPASTDDAGRDPPASAAATAAAARPPLPPGDSLAGTLPLANAATTTGTTPSSPVAIGSGGVAVFGTTRPTRLTAFPPSPTTARSDSLTLPLAGAAGSPPRAQHEHHHHHHHPQQPLPQRHPSPPHVCSRCASLTHPSTPGDWEEDWEDVEKQEEDAPWRRGAWRGEGDGDQPGPRGGGGGAGGAGAPRRRGWVVAPMRSAQTQTVVSWGPFFAGAGGRAVHSAYRDGDEGEEEEEAAAAAAAEQEGGGRARSGRVVSGQGVVRVVDVGGEQQQQQQQQRQQQQRQQQQRQQQQRQQRQNLGRQDEQQQQRRRDTDDSSSAEEIFPRTRPGGGDDDDASAGVGLPRRSDSGRRAVGTSWLRLSMG